MLLDEDSGLTSDGHFLVGGGLLSLLEEFSMVVLDVVSEQSSGFRDDGACLFVLCDLLLELLVFQMSLLVEFIDVSLVSLGLGGLLGNQFLEDLSLWVELALKSGLELDLLSV